ncbi:Cdc15p [Rhizophagus irregularis DAOM 197198w]|uniref:Cdc15p n=2 Tax=Rhizophagus irregularis TaxID=588596 RepID=A0A015M6S1_RHIIW|nr:Cdc15p [Rhizophagus irregularis DAOM 197198w]
MQLAKVININDENSFDPTPRLKSSHIPIKFISFDRLYKNCIYCGEKYIRALFCSQKYCKKCLSRYITDIRDNNICLDIYGTLDLECNEHEVGKTKVLQNIQECCENCVRILCFKQIGRYCLYYLDNHNKSIYNKVIESEKNCKLCGKSLYQGTVKDIMSTFKLCSDCYLVSFEWIESTLFKKQVLIFHSPLWEDESYCANCRSKLIFTSECQKHCANCLIFYTGCRYCLTTNIIFGLTGQSQCKKCKRISLIVKSNEDNDDLFLNDIIYDSSLFDNIANSVNAIDKYFNPLALSRISSNYRLKYIPYSQFEGVEKMTKGGYGIIYKATWLPKNKIVILKRFKNSKYFLNELKSIRHCFNGLTYGYIINFYGFTKDSESNNYILVMEYASGGDLHKHLQKNFTNITWFQKLNILKEILTGLESIHSNEFIHRDFHTGNILLENLRFSLWKIGDLGLSQAVNDRSSNNEIYGVIPYIAPEIFKKSAFSKEADIYSLGMIMWELTTGCKPFANAKHDHNLIYKILDGERPKITEDTPESYANFMKRCWDPDPKKRPSLKDMIKSYNYDLEFKSEFEQAEVKREKLIETKMIGPEFAEKCHSEAIYISRPLSALISKCSSTYSYLFGKIQYYEKSLKILYI